MLYLKTTRKEKEKRKKDFIQKKQWSEGPTLFYVTNNVQKTGQNVYNIFLDLAVNAAE